MPAYFFHVRGANFDTPDLIGRECDGPEAARSEAERMAAELLESALLAGNPPPDAVIEDAFLPGATGSDTRGAGPPRLSGSPSGQRRGPG